MRFSTYLIRWICKETSKLHFQAENTPMGLLWRFSISGSIVDSSTIRQWCGTWAALTTCLRIGKRCVRVVLSPLCSSTHAKTVFNTRSNAFPVVARKSIHFSTAPDMYDNTSASRLMPLPQCNQVLPDDFHIQTLFVGKPRVACSLAKTKVSMQYSPLLQRVLQCVLQCNSRVAYSLAKTKVFMQCPPLLQHVLQCMLQYVLQCKPCVACSLAKTKVHMRCSLLLQFVLNPPLPPYFSFPFSGVHARVRDFAWHFISSIYCVSSMVAVSISWMHSWRVYRPHESTAGIAKTAKHCTTHCNTIQHTLQHTHKMHKSTAGIAETATYCNAHRFTLRRTLQHTHRLQESTAGTVKTPFWARKKASRFTGLAALLARMAKPVYFAQVPTWYMLYTYAYIYTHRPRNIVGPIGKANVVRSCATHCNVL